MSDQDGNPEDRFSHFGADFVCIFLLCFNDVFILFQAIAVTFVRFFLAPLKDIGTAVSEFIRALLIDLPLTLYPVAIAIVAVFSFMFLFMWFGYSIRLPFFLTIERPAQLSVADSKLNEALTDSSQQIMKQVIATF